MGEGCPERPLHLFGMLTVIPSGAGEIGPPMTGRRELVIVVLCAANMVALMVVLVAVFWLHARVAMLETQVGGRYWS